jgi:hypothetical protein
MLGQLERGFYGKRETVQGTSVKFRELAGGQCCAELIRPAQSQLAFPRIGSQHEASSILLIRMGSLLML